MHFEKDDIPPGFGMLLGRNENAMKCFSGMTKGGDIIRSVTYEAFMPLIAVALIYLIMVMGLSKVVNLLERKLRSNER